MQIGELARQAGVSVQTVRFYERSRLLPEPQRKDSGYRDYTAEDVHRLKFIRQAKALGFSLEEIRDILRMRERGKCPCVDVIKMAEGHLDEVQRQITQLRKFQTELTSALRSWRRAGVSKLAPDAFCVLIERTMDKPVPGKRRA